MWVLKHFEKQNSWDRVCIPHLLMWTNSTNGTNSTDDLGLVALWLGTALCPFPQPFFQSCRTSSLWGAMQQGCPGCSGLGSLDRRRNNWQSLPLALCVQGFSAQLMNSWAKHCLGIAREECWGLSVSLGLSTPGAPGQRRSLRIRWLSDSG